MSVRSAATVLILIKCLARSPAVWVDRAGRALAREKLEEHFWGLRKRRTRVGAAHSGVTKERVQRVLGIVGRGENADIVDAVFALLDDTLPSQFARLAKTHRFCDGATTAQVGCHVGILQRGSGKLDREGRDYWIKPLRDLGAVEPITLPRDGVDFVAGHIQAKSPNSAYRLSKEFVKLLRGNEETLAARVRGWAAEDAARARLELQKRMADAAREQFTNEHGALIDAVVETYAPQFLPGFECIYVDSDDGDRVTASERAVLRVAGIELELSDPYPDVMLFERKGRRLWCVEAVTSDGEVDEHKASGVKQLCARFQCELAGLTTAYSTRKDWLRRQSQHQNIALGTFVWAADDPGVHYLMQGPPRK